MDCRIWWLIVLPKILFDKFPLYTWAHNELFSHEAFMEWQADYEEWKNAKSIRTKNKIAQKWAVKVKKSTYKKKRK
jgi:hypothetical protein|tara:strand:+ start:254 stop:481 length:228 start_codon:yes stop_codon:yes gene_type:complete